MQRTYPQGVTSWVDIEQDDVEAATAFYGAVLGWTFHDATPPQTPARYVVAQVEGRDAAGIGGPRTPTGSPGDPSWQTYVAVDDVAATLRRVEEVGATVTAGPTVAGEGGTWAAFTDPQGARLRLWQPRRRLGAQITNAPGTWNFSDLRTTDPAAAQDLYGRLFGWEFTDLGFATMIRVPGYGDHLAATVDPGIHERQDDVSAPPGFADAIGWITPTDGPATWHVTFSVEDRDATAEAVERHGGTVLGSEVNDWTRAVTVRDPQGAELTLSQFVPPT
ncbi:VOC family protein [Cellulomonas fimi]|uniref:Glyoxalase/bleomycin resistance protein/dioxygenase n=1 Tax=Cellulomonas fimi (strain ATCC 484 / DSM 20113 / JCM 1341 / CCUG 24087 / LMG 16345 / NBRC 15513 / NCIMB 8980 / NCTC 7547 / NRS-133) TaxID=590998 RepID=F4GZW0_CELFA|nr:VOC family protein [Cellulomonas fimi]AEE47276.1 Glyoxalase/bleomycin resistance protein/dioxygenase [Cellulomonas fimi ATCC 484]NNH06990.1 VOC family protein [Cellulomonas fimi]VEH35785.1 27 kDa antigen Cfp30B [Cellulomonas fimi]